MRARVQHTRAERPAPETARRDVKPENLGEAIKIPLPDLVNEVVIIAAALVDLDARKRLTQTLTVDHFQNKQHAAIWQVIVDLEKKGLAYDPATVRQLSGGKVDTNYLDSLIQQRPALPPNLQHHVDVLQWDRAKVEILKGPFKGLVDSIREQGNPEEVRARARQVSLAFDNAGGSLRFLRDPHNLVIEQREEVRQRRVGTAIWPYGVEGFDQYADGPKKGQWRVLPGTAPGMTTVLTGVSSSGKSTLTTQIILKQVELGRRVLYGAWEEGAGCSLEWLAQMSLRMSRTRLITGDITDEEEERLGQEMERLAQYVRFFELPFGVMPEKSDKRRDANNRNLDLIHEYLVLVKPDVFVADLWRRAAQLLDADMEEIALYRQQAIARSLKIHQILIHQQRLKDIELRVDKQPTRDGLKGSGAWVEIADTIIGTHREHLFKAVPDDTVRLLLLKQRKGLPAMAVDCDYDPETGFISGGRCAEYDRPGAAGALDTFLDDMGSKRVKGGKGRK